MTVRAIVLGAGKGVRMQSDLAKVLHPVAGRPMLHWVLDVVSAAACDDTVVVVGHQADAVRAILPDGVRSVLQEEQLGTGHATMVGLQAIDVEADDEVIVLPGDMPLVRSETLTTMLRIHRDSGAAATLLTVAPEESPAFGRIIRRDGAVVAIVEAKDATPEQLAIKELCTSVYVFSGALLPAALERISTENAQGEYYLTDVIGILVGDGHRIETFTGSPEEGLGINTVAQIAEVESALRRRSIGPL